MPCGDAMTTHLQRPAGTAASRETAPARGARATATPRPRALVADRRTEDGLAAARPVRFAARDVDRSETREERLARDQAARRSAVERRGTAVHRRDGARAARAKEALNRAALACLPTLPARRGGETVHAAGPVAAPGAAQRTARWRGGRVASVDDDAGVSAGVSVPVEHEGARHQGQHACSQAGDGCPVDVVRDAGHPMDSIAASARRTRGVHRLFAALPLAPDGSARTARPASHRTQLKASV